MTRNEQPSFDPTLYDADFFVWTQRQAAALRAMPHDPAVDLEHVAEEIEDLGRRDLRDVTSHLGRLIEHLLKIDADPQARAESHWRHEARLFARDAKRAYTPGMRQRIDMPSIWRDGVDLALGYYADRDIAFRTPAACPFTLHDLLPAVFDLDAALAQLATARTSTPEATSHDP